MEVTFASMTHPPAMSVVMTHVPAEFAVFVARYQQHLNELVINFRAFGLEEESIVQHVHQLASSYKTALLIAARHCYTEPESA